MAGRKARPRYSRSTRGCYTCRLRHLKCDESFPCRHCLSSGWQCDGPRRNTDLVFRVERPNMVRRFNAQPQREPSPFVWLTNPQEKRAFEYYLRSAGPLLSGALDWDFWGSLVPCLAESDVAVRYIMLAISHFCEHPLRTSEHGKIEVHPLSSQHVVALQWQARALSIDRQGDAQTAISSLILKYALLSSHEIQQDNYRSGWRLLRVAFSLVVPLITSGCENSVSLSVTDHQVLKILVPLMMRNVCLLFNSSTSSSRYVPHAKSVEQIEAEVFHHLCIIYASIKTHFLAIQSHARVENDRFLAEMENVRSVLLMLRAETSTNPCSDDQQQPVRLRALHEYCDIGVYWLDILASLVHDNSDEPELLQTVLEATKKLSVTASTFFPTAASTDFFHSFALYPTAFFVTILSKDPRLRAEALALLNGNPHHKSIPHLLALVRKTEQHSSHYADEIDRTGVFQIYHGSKDTELLVDDVYDGSI